MAQLPIMQSGDQTLNLMQNRWGSVLNPVLQNPLLYGNLIADVALTTGDNTINHRLGREPLGYIIVAVDAAAVIYQVASTMPNLTLVLNSDVDCTISIYVF